MKIARLFSVVLNLLYLLGLPSCNGLACGTLTLTEQMKNAMEGSWASAVVRVQQFTRRARLELPCGLDMTFPANSTKLQLYEVLDVFKGDDLVVQGDAIHLVQTYPQIQDLDGVGSYDNFLVILQREVDTCCTEFAASSVIMKRSSQTGMHCTETAPLNSVWDTTSAVASRIYAVPDCYAFPLWSYLNDEEISILKPAEIETAVSTESSTMNHAYTYMSRIGVTVSLLVLFLSNIS